MRTTTRRAFAAGGLALSVFIGACGGGDSTIQAGGSGGGGGGGEESTTTAPSGGGGGADAAAGKTMFGQTCAACHGPDAKGLPGLGKDLTTSQFAKGLSDTALVDFVKKGRDTSDPANTTGVAMPPKGGNPALSDDDIASIVAYVRTLEK